MVLQAVLGGRQVPDQPLDLAPIRRRLPDIPREDMSQLEEDRADLLAEVDRLTAALAEARGEVIADA